MSADFAFENMVALNFMNLSKARALEVLEARNAVREFMLTRREISETEHFRFIESLRETKNMAYFAVYNVEVDSSLRDSIALAHKNSAFIGVVCLNNIDLANKNALLGIYSVANANNGVQLLKILRFIAFNELNLHILYAKVLSTNIRAIRFYQKNGFVHCGTMIEAIKDKENFIDLDIWALRNETFYCESCNSKAKQSKMI